ncbi:hypothetical protein D068_cds37740 [Bacillus atrophaeus UCMB-5137]|nr:hypothetical protein D068_cds37740 [Bacillus atrophaeus UCMB-5137]
MEVGSYTYKAIHKQISHFWRLPVWRRGNWISAIFKGRGTQHDAITHFFTAHI